MLMCLAFFRSELPTSDNLEYVYKVIDSIVKSLYSESDTISVNLHVIK